MTRLTFPARPTRTSFPVAGRIRQLGLAHVPHGSSRPFEEAEAALRSRETSPRTLAQRPQPVAQEPGSGQDFRGRSLRLGQRAQRLELRVQLFGHCGA